MELGEETLQEVERPPFELLLTLTATFLTGDHPLDELGDDLRDLGPRSSKRNTDHDLTALAIRGDVALATFTLHDPYWGIVGELEGGLN